VDETQRQAIDELLLDYRQWEAKREERRRNAKDLADQLGNPDGRSAQELESLMDELKRLIDPASPEPSSLDHPRSASSIQRRASDPPASTPLHGDGQFDEDDEDDELDRKVL
jgi:hypothetical protein